jgi:hypothetical protein
MSFLIGAAAVLASLLLASALAGLLLLVPINVDGAVVLIIFSIAWFGGFFLSLPWQRRSARALDLRRPGASLEGNLLTVPVPDKPSLVFKLDEPYELIFGWFDVVTKSTGGPTTNTRSLMTYAILSQAGRQLFLKAEDSIREAQGAGWPKATSSITPEVCVRLWASDLVALVEAVRAYKKPTPAPVVKTLPATIAVNMPAKEEAVRDWHENPLPARNRHEVTLFLEWLKVELVSRTTAGEAEICVGRTPESAEAVSPYMYRFVFTLLEADPFDENDFGSGVSRIFDPMELMLLLSRLESEGLLGVGAYDMRNNATHLLTHKTTREIAARRRANARGIGLLEQLMRFAQADGYPAEECIKTSASRTYYRRTRERFHLNALKARQQALRENLELLELPATNMPWAGKHAALVRELSARCPDYLIELQVAGFADEQVRHPHFSHSFHLMRFAARALKQGEVDKARQVFAAWKAAEPNDLSFPHRDLAEALHELNLDLQTAMPFVPPSEQNSFAQYYGTLIDPGYNPWLY